MYDRMTSPSPKRSSSKEKEVLKENKAVAQKPLWVDDEDLKACSRCQKKFNFFRKKVHCAACGTVACKNCCPKDCAIPLSNLGYEGNQIVCLDCFKKWQAALVVGENVGGRGESEERFGLQHKFAEMQFSAPTVCHVCNQLIWGLGLQKGFRCKDCNYSTHQQCCFLAPNTCSLSIQLDSRLRHIEQREVEKLWEIWKMYCASKNGIKISEFLKFFKGCVQSEVKKSKKININLQDDAEVFRMFRAIDRNNNGLVSFEEYILFIAKVRDPSPEDLLQITFLIYDLNNDGSLSRDELHHALEKSRVNLFPKWFVKHEEGNSGDLVRAMVDLLFEKLDDNHDNKLSLKEVMNGYQRDPSLLAQLGIVGESK